MEIILPRQLVSPRIRLDLHRTMCVGAGAFIYLHLGGKVWKSQINFIWKFGGNFLIKFQTKRHFKNNKSAEREVDAHSHRHLQICTAHRIALFIIIELAKMRGEKVEKFILCVWALARLGTAIRETEQTFLQSHSFVKAHEYKYTQTGIHKVL